MGSNQNDYFTIRTRGFWVGQPINYERHYLPWFGVGNNGLPPIIQIK